MVRRYSMPMPSHGMCEPGKRRDAVRYAAIAWSDSSCAAKAWPKPTQSAGVAGGPPIVLGGAAGPKTAKDIAEFCDGWMPIGGRHAIDGWAEVVAACEAIDRDPATIELGVFGAAPSEEKLTKLADIGMKRAVFVLPQGPRDEVMAELEKNAPLIEAMRSA